MSRISGATETEATGSVVTPAWLVNMGIKNGNGVYTLCAYDADITFGGTTYKRAPFTIQALEEREDGAISSQQIVFSLDEQDLVSVLATEANYVWQPLDITLVLIDRDTGSPLADPVYKWIGYMVSKATAQNANSGTISIIGQDWLSILGHTGRVRFDDVSQQARSAGDTFFSQMPGLQGQHVIWMGASVSANGYKPDANPPPGRADGALTRTK